MRQRDFNAGVRVVTGAHDRPDWSKRSKVRKKMACIEKENLELKQRQARSRQLREQRGSG